MFIFINIGMDSHGITFTIQVIVVGAVVVGAIIGGVVTIGTKWLLFGL